MATLDVLTVYQSWKGFQLFDEVMVQMHRYQFLKSWQWMSTVVFGEGGAGSENLI